MSIDVQMTQLLSDMQALRKEAMQRDVLPKDDVIQQKSASFGDMFKTAIDQVNELQTHSAELKNSFELGDKDVDIAQVMIASEKAKVGFTAMIEVRNKFVEAYRDVMNMPV